MGFSDKQVRALSRSVPADAIRTRMSSGKELTFIEGWYAVAQANRIFGFDGWDRETVETKCLQAREARGTFTAIYSAKVRITVRTADAVVVREGHGTGEAQRRLVRRGSGSRPQGGGDRRHQAGARHLRQGVRPRALCRERRPAAKRRGAPAETDEHGDAAQRRQRGEPSPLTRHVAAPAGRTQRPSSLSASAEAASATTGRRPHAARHFGPSAPRPSARIDKNLLAFPEPHRVRDKEHLRYVAAQPCLLCSATPSDPHHVRFAQPRAMARKVGDDFTVPLCRKHHRDLHDSGNEAAWWHDMGIEPLEIAKDLWEESRENAADVREPPPRRGAADDQRRDKDATRGQWSQTCRGLS